VFPKRNSLKKKGEKGKSTPPPSKRGGENVVVAPDCTSPSRKEDGGKRGEKKEKKGEKKEKSLGLQNPKIGEEKRKKGKKKVLCLRSGGGKRKKKGAAQAPCPKTDTEGKREGWVGKKRKEERDK